MWIIPGMWPWWGSVNLGIAIANYQGFQGRGFNIVIGFDSDPEKVGKKIGNLTVKPISETGTCASKRRYF